MSVRSGRCFGGCTLREREDKTQDKKKVCLFNSDSFPTKQNLYFVYNQLANAAAASTGGGLIYRNKKIIQKQEF